MPPLIVTLALADADQRHFDALRSAHFPPERNHLAAHVTLFHALPDEQLDRVRARGAGTGLALWRYLEGPWEPLGVHAHLPRT